jgi:hypothetical protein
MGIVGFLVYFAVGVLMILSEGRSCQIEKEWKRRRPIFEVLRKVSVGITGSGV